MRRFPRYRVAIPVTFWGPEAAGEGRIINLSAGGCAVESDVSPSPGQQLRLFAVLPVSHATMMIDVAPVRWAHNRLFGVEFVGVQAASQEILSQWLAQLAAKST